MFDEQAFLKQFRAHALLTATWRESHPATMAAPVGRWAVYWGADPDPVVRCATFDAALAVARRYAEASGRIYRVQEV